MLRVWTKMDPQRKCEKTPVFTTPFSTLLQRFLREHGEVHISAMGTAVSSAVIVAEVLKNRNLVTEKRLEKCLELVGASARQVGC